MASDAAYRLYGFFGAQTLALPRLSLRPPAALLITRCRPLLCKQVSKDVFKIDQVYEIPHSKGQFRARAEARESLDDNFLDTLMAVDYIERAIGHGNLAGAQEVLNKVTAYLGEKESEDVQRLIDNAVAENPIVDALACHANQVLELVKETGGSIATHKDEAGNETHAVLIADFESVAESRDGRGRGLAALRVFAPGEVRRTCSCSVFPPCVRLLWPKLPGHTCDRRPCTHARPSQWDSEAMRRAYADCVGGGTCRPHELEVGKQGWGWSG
jgi:hypothetical protein